MDDRGTKDHRHTTGDQHITERRHCQRQRTLMSATLRSRTRTGTHSCLVRNLSERGAMLVCTGVAWLPDVFELEIAYRDLRVEARAVWRDNTGMGIAFSGTLAGDARPARIEDKLTQFQAEREALRQRLTELIEPY
jgi:PilZ domain